MKSLSVESAIQPIFRKVNACKCSVGAYFPKKARDDENLVPSPDCNFLHWLHFSTFSFDWPKNLLYILLDCGFTICCSCSR